MPRHPEGSPTELIPIVQKPGLVRNLLDQLGMVGPYRWELIQSVQPVIVVAEQSPAIAGRRPCFSQTTRVTAGQLAALALFNPAGSGVIARVEHMATVVDFVTPAIELRTMTSDVGTAPSTVLYRDFRLTGSPACTVKGGVASTGTQISYLDAFDDPASGETPRGLELPVAILAEGTGLMQVTSAVGTGTVWQVVWWTEESV